jgi:hypothetical protein
MNYPADWLCECCKRPFSQHVQIGAPKGNDKGQQPASHNWCYSYKELMERKSDLGGLSFEPMDNLSLVEFLAKQKNLIK